MSADLIAFSHLRWDFVHQRPQHILLRMARGRRVFYVEEPVATNAGHAYLELAKPAPGVMVCRPHLPGAAPGFEEENVAALRALLMDLIATESIGPWIAWFYSPMALPLLRDQSPAGVVYDCMDQLSAFRGAPPQMEKMEERLLDAADLVLTGGRSLYEARKGRHSQVHCFPSSVDQHHFRPGTERSDPPAQAGLPHPRLGFFGVLDERFDSGLLSAIADARPDWQFVMVGPVVKIDPGTLPRRPNILYTGHQSYASLPDYVAGWDVCLLLFARNEATRFISPTKTLEYMAAERPIVSTSIRDVVADYSDVVGIADEPEAFVRLCEQALARTESERSREVLQMRRLLSRTSWDRTVEAIDGLVARIEGVRALETAPEDDADRPIPTLSSTAAPAPSRPGSRASSRAWSRASTRASSGDRHPAVIIGAGPTGLSAAYHLGEEALLLERQDRIGGYCRSIQAGGFTFDQAGHIMFSKDPYVHELYEVLLGDNVHWQDREAWVYTDGVHTRYPFQGALYGLPSEVVRDCLMGAIEACDAKARDPERAPQNFEEFIHMVWGAGIARHFALPYNRKLWSVPLEEMETSWLGGRVPMPALDEMIQGALEPSPPPMGPNARFGYPLSGGFQALMDGFLPHLTGELRLGADVRSIEPDRRTLHLEDGTVVSYDQLVSTMPLPALIRSMGTDAPAAVRHAAEGLRAISVRCVNLGVGRPAITDRHWTYYAGDSIFHRIFFQGNASPHCNPPGGFGLTCEITYSKYKPLPVHGEALIRRCIEDCVRVGVLEADDRILEAHEVDMPSAYIVYDHARAEHVATIRGWLEDRGIRLAGRYSEWEYYNSDHAFLAGKRVAEAVRAAQSAQPTSPIARSPLRTRRRAGQALTGD